MPASARFGAITLALAATAEWTSSLPTVEHAVLDTNVFPSRLDHADSLVAGLDLSLRFAF